MSAIDRLGYRALERLIQHLEGLPLRMVLWNGQVLGAAETRAEYTVRVHDRAALLRLLLDPDVGFGDLYTEGRISVEGDLPELLTRIFRANLDWKPGSRWLPRRLIQGALHNDLISATRNARHHYDVGNEFYRLWLDERMVYTCAYFPSPADSLEDAQLAKMDHVCRKIGLRADERVIEAGSGWGALALHMARYYGARVRAFNVSEQQVLYAREQAEKQGLQERVEFVMDDYRNADGRCDAFMSVGMLEHVGPAHYAELGRVIDRCLEPDGRGLIHTIGRSRPQRLNRWIEKRVFPNAYPPTLKQMMEILEPAGLVTLDVENLRRHYALTCQSWLDRFERHYERAEDLVGPLKTRAWHLYLAGATAAFRASTLELFQLVFTRAGNDRIPWTRARVHAGNDRFGGSRAESDAQV